MAMNLTSNDVNRDRIWEWKGGGGERMGKWGKCERPNSINTHLLSIVPLTFSIFSSPTYAKRLSWLLLCLDTKALDGKIALVPHHITPHHTTPIQLKAHMSKFFEWHQIALYELVLDWTAAVAAAAKCYINRFWNHYHHQSHRNSEIDVQVECAIFLSQIYLLVVSVMQWNNGNDWDLSVVQTISPYNKN